MGVVLAVTRIAIRGQSDLGNFLGDVAGVAIEAAMRASQRVTRLRVMIKAPPHPTIRIMAERAVRTQAALMMLVGVAGGAIQRRALKRQRAVAFLASYDGVASNQRKSSDVVIEGLYLAPTGFSMTLLAAATKLALVPIVLPVTRYTARCQLVAIEIAGMARIALDLRMRSSQRKFRRLVVIEENRFPLVLFVTGLAFSAVSSGVNILNPVAIDARSANPLVAFANMAPGAGDGAMCALEPEPGLIVVERFDTTPYRFAVTIVARFPEAALVRIVHLMTVEAASRRVAKFYRLRVTAGALHGFVSVPQLEIRKRVIEGLAIKQDYVGVSPLMIGVTMVALLLRCIRLSPVKSLTRRSIRGCFLVACQA